MKPKKNIEYNVLAAIQGIGAASIYLYVYNLPWPQGARVSLAQAGIFMFLFALGAWFSFVLWKCISSYVINLSKYFYYKTTGEKTISLCIWPFFWTNSKWTVANIFWGSLDRTCFSMNKYLADRKGLEKLSAYILKRNRMMLGIYSSFTLVVLSSLFHMKMYSLMWMFFWGGISCMIDQMDYQKIGSTDTMAFAGVTGIKKRLVLHMLANQSRMEKLTIGKEVAEYLSEEMYDPHGGYYFNYLCLSAIYNHVCYGMESQLISYMDEKVDNILRETPDAMKIVSNLDNDFKYKNIEKPICLFYANYREFLLYVLMYYKLENKTGEAIRLSNYIRYMLREIESKCVKDNMLSEYFLNGVFVEYENLYQNVIRHEFTPETTIFAGYHTLPLWKESRHDFVQKYNEMG